MWVWNRHKASCWELPELRLVWLLSKASNYACVNVVLSVFLFCVGHCYPCSAFCSNICWVPIHHPLENLADRLMLMEVAALVPGST